MDLTDTYSSQHTKLAHFSTYSKMIPHCSILLYIVCFMLQNVLALALVTELDSTERREDNRRRLLERKQAFYQVSDPETVSA
jgi:hypothetical protein